jgi:hypothetical protein
LLVEVAVVLVMEVDLVVVEGLVDLELRLVFL